MRIDITVLLVWVLTDEVFGRPLQCSRPCRCRSQPVSSAVCDYDIIEPTMQRPQLDPSIEVIEINCRMSRNKTCESYTPARNRFPAAFFPKYSKLTSVKITNCRIGQLPSLAFLKNLKEVRIKNVPVIGISGNIFHESNSLKYLYLDRMNCLEYLGGGLLKDKRKFQKLKMTHTNFKNGIGIKHVLKDLGPSFQRFIWISNRNDLTLPMDIFKKFKLKVLDLSKTMLTDLDFLYDSSVSKSLILWSVSVRERITDFDFSSCSKLQGIKILDLTAVNLMQLRAKHFSNFSHLEKLQLAKNSIGRIDGLIFRKMTRLKYLDISHNNIKTIPDSLSYLLERRGFQLKIGNNPLHCNCEIKWLLKFPFLLNNVLCETAEKTDMIGKELINLRILDATCSKPAPPIVTIEIYASERHYDQNNYKKELTLTEKGGQVTINKSEVILLRCASQGDPPPNMAWEVISENGERKIDSQPKGNSQRFNSIEWSIRQEEMKFGRYVLQCRASNMKASERLNVTIFNAFPTVTIPPMPSSPAIELNAAVGKLNGSEVIYDSRTSSSGHSLTCSNMRTGIGLVLTAWLWRPRG